MLLRAFPEDNIVGEEDAADMRAESGASLRNRIVELVNETVTAPLQAGETDAWGLGPDHAQTPEQIMDIIDRGNYNGGSTGRESTIEVFPPQLIASQAFGLSTLSTARRASSAGSSMPFASLSSSTLRSNSASWAARTFLYLPQIPPVLVAASLSPPVVRGRGKSLLTRPTPLLPSLLPFLPLQKTP